MKIILTTILLTCVIATLGSYILNARLVASTEQNVQTAGDFTQGKFHNAVAQTVPTISKTLAIMLRYVSETKKHATPEQPLPMPLVTRQQLNALSDDDFHLIKLGHSSLLLKVYGEYWLIDPVFSERASPFSFLGPKRFQPTPITIAELPPIDKVLISHNHYDHLDQAAVKQLIKKTRQFLVPLGVEGDLQKWGVAPDNILRFDWWQELQSEHALLAFTPTQHFSGRGIGDGNKTLWGSWVIKTKQHSVYFSGDSGYFAGFKTIGDKYGPFDLTMIETGAYDKDWPDIHMTPEESVQAHIDLKGKTMLPIHNGTFDLAFHPWYDPLIRVSAAATTHNIALTMPKFGEVFTVEQAPIRERWWPTAW